VGGIDKHFLSHVSLMHRAKRVVLTHPGGQALLGRCLVRAISDGARQGLALWPPARSLKRCARVIAVLLRQARSWSPPAHLFLSPGIFRAQALHCPDRGTIGLPCRERWIITCGTAAKLKKAGLMGVKIAMPVRTQ
jgi:hypothetical protein